MALGSIVYVTLFVVAAHIAGPGGSTLVIDTGLCTGSACVVVMDVAAMGMAIVPIVEVPEWGRRV